MAKRPRALVLIAQDMRRFMHEERVSQVALAEGAGVSQSQVSRLLSGKVQRLSKSVVALCSYAGIRAYDSAVADPRRNDMLMEALRKVWDGTHEHARSIAHVIASLERFRQ